MTEIIDKKTTIRDAQGNDNVSRAQNIKSNETLVPKADSPQQHSSEQHSSEQDASVDIISSIRDMMKASAEEIEKLKQDAEDKEEEIDAVYQENIKLDDLHKTSRKYISSNGYEVEDDSDTNEGVVFKETKSDKAQNYSSNDEFILLATKILEPYINVWVSNNLPSLAEKMLSAKIDAYLENITSNFKKS